MFNSGIRKNTDNCLRGAVRFRPAMAGLGAMMVVLTTLATARAAVLAQYDFTSNSAISTDSETLSSASNFVIAAGWTGSNNSPATGQITSDEFRVTTQATGGGSADCDTLAEAINLNTYGSFTLQTNGNATDLNNLTFDHKFHTTSGGAVSMTVALLSSLAGFSAGNEIATFNINQSADTTISRDISLTAGAFQNLTSSVEFRLYFYDASDVTGRYQSVDNIILNGSVPEPVLGGLMAGGCLLALGRRLRK